MANFEHTCEETFGEINLLCAQVLDLFLQLIKSVKKKNISVFVQRLSH